MELSGEIAHAGFITRRDMIDQFATTDFAPTLAATTDEQLADLSDVLGEQDIALPRLTWAEVALTARVVDERPSRSVVEVWSVSVIAAPDVGVPRQAWRTVTVELVWEDDWKVDGWAAEPGPTPAMAAGEAVSSVDEIEDVAGWPAAGVVEPVDAETGGVE